MSSAVTNWLYFNLTFFRDVINVSENLFIPFTNGFLYKYYKKIYILPVVNSFSNNWYLLVIVINSTNPEINSEN